jgi:hypothetical protein
VTCYGDFATARVASLTRVEVRECSSAELAASLRVSPALRQLMRNRRTMLDHRRRSVS